jgi:ATPase subunit of ABC transporter with duplicated ATPase domains
MDEPTNHLDIESISRLEDFLYDLDSIVIVVSHDRHFLNRVCTHIADIDFGKIQVYVGNYDFWLESSQLALQQTKDANKKTEAKRKELQEFIQRFSANASKSKQATSRKRQLEKLTLEDIKPSSRRLPWINFKPLREAGDSVLTIKGLNKTIDGEAVLQDTNLVVYKGDKIALVGSNELAKSTLLQILMGEMDADSGECTWGLTTTRAYFPKDNSAYFNSDLNLVDWLRQYTTDQEETFVRGFLGRMLFSGEESQKQASVLSGGERVRCMLARMMLSGANVLLLDEPTNHLDVEAITALNNGLADYPGTVFLVSHDHQLLQTVANRIIEITPAGVIDKMMTYDEYLEARKDAAPRDMPMTMLV